MSGYFHGLAFDETMAFATMVNTDPRLEYDLAQVRRLHAGAPATRQRRTCAAAKKGVQGPLWQAACRAGGLRSARAAARRLADHVQCVCEARVGLPAHVLSCASSCAYAIKGQFLLSRPASALCSTPVCPTLTLWTF